MEEHGGKRPKLATIWEEQTAEELNDKFLELLRKKVGANKGEKEYHSDLLEARTPPLPSRLRYSHKPPPLERQDTFTQTTLNVSWADRVTQTGDKNLEK